MRRNFVLGTLFILLFSLIASTGSATAAQVNPPNPSRLAALPKNVLDALGVSVAPDGWVTYLHPNSSKLNLAQKKNYVIKGIKGSDGSCKFEDSHKGGPNAPMRYAETMAQNNSICQRRMVSGNISPQDGASLRANPSRGNSHLANTPNVAKATSASTAAFASYTFHSGSRYIDPAQIVITALDADLTWSANGVDMVGANYNINTYAFPYDGWSDWGTPHPPLEFGNGYVIFSATDEFTNTDFEQVLLYTALLVGGPLAQAAVVAACGFDTSPAVFYHSEYLEGVFDGSYYTDHFDFNMGGCSDLVRHDQYDGYGY